MAFLVPPFCSTLLLLSITPSQDFLSKHSVLANAAHDVVFSGEFFILPSVTSSDCHALIIDNNSGTYAPDKAALPSLEALLKQNFPDLEVHAVAVGSEEHTAFVKRLNSGRMLGAEAPGAHTLAPIASSATALVAAPGLHSVDAHGAPLPSMPSLISPADS
jgi:hypothetical protein